MYVSDDEFRAQVNLVVADLQELADSLVLYGMVGASGRVLTGRQVIRALWTKLNQQTPTPQASEAPLELLTPAPPEGA